MAPFGSSMVEWIFMAVVLSVAGALLLRTQRYFSRQARTPTSYEPPGGGRRKGDIPHLREASSGPIRQTGDVPFSPAVPAPDALQRWEVEMHDLGRELSARLDSKMSVLQHLIRDADRAAARLESAMAATGPGPRAPILPPEGQRANQAEALFSGASAAGEASAYGRPGQTHPGRYDEIYLMADYGHPAAEIAKKLGLPIGEVELILSLRTRR